LLCHVTLHGDERRLRRALCRILPTPAALLSCRTASASNENRFVSRILGSAPPMNIFFFLAMLKLIHKVTHGNHAPSADRGPKALYTSNFHFIDNLSLFYYYRD
jgi:hypothetical protein